MFVSLVLVALSRLEGNLFELSKQLASHHEFVTSVVYFGLINVNVVLVLILSFLIFRNIAKLVLERRKGIFGSSLRSRLVVALVFFALAPTVLLFYISSRFLTESFDTWFSAKVEATMIRTREAGALVYERDKRRIEGLARIALQRVRLSEGLPFGNNQDSTIDPTPLKGFTQEYRLYSVKVLNTEGAIIWSSDQNTGSEVFSEKGFRFVIDAISRFRSYPGMTSKAIVDVDQGQDVVRGIAPILSPQGQTLLGVILTEERFDTQILKSIEGIISEFANLKPGAELIRLSYLILLVLMVVIIVFSATWLGFFVAKGIIAPIQSLADATKKVSDGNYNVSLEPRGDDETGQLIKSFNSMISELSSHENQVQEFTSQLEKTNLELDQRRNYMEVILRNISAGVISVSSSGIITSVNRAAEKLLNVSALDSVGKDVQAILNPHLFQNFWQPIIERVQESSEFNGQIILESNDNPLTILADGFKISDENGIDLGIVVVFDDASEQVKVQRVAAWREVARRIAHEIKNPITPIKLSAQRLLRKFESRFEQRDREIFASCIETIISEVDSLRDLVNEFSKFARLPGVKTRPEDLNSVIKDVVAMFSMSYSDVIFETSLLSEELPRVMLDREQMVRVFTNLIANSIAALPGGGTDRVISCSTEMIEDARAVKIGIADLGSGIPDNIKQRVIEPYFSTKQEGTGLGLAIVNQIVSDHGGYFRIFDNEPRGTLMIIELPIHK